MNNPIKIPYSKRQHEKNILRTEEIIRKIDSIEIPNNRSEIRLFALTRNESLRLPYFISYYLEKSVDRLIIIDNNSSDATIQIALSYPNVHVIKISESYTNHWDWMEYFLGKYGKDHWCICVDIDELLYYPYIQTICLKKLVHFLDLNNYTALRCFLLDIYSDKALSETEYIQGRNPLETCKYFDADFNKEICAFFDKNQWKRFESIIYNGGMRERVFGQELPSNLKVYKKLPYHLSKVPVFKNNGNTYLTQGMHAINGANLANIQGVLFHTKFMGDFVSEVKEEVEREEHYGKAIMYKIFNHQLDLNPNLCLKDENSHRLENTRQLLDLKIMRSSSELDSYASKFRV